MRINCTCPKQNFYRPENSHSHPGFHLKAELWGWAPSRRPYRPVSHNYLWLGAVCVPVVLFLLSKTLNRPENTHSQPGSHLKVELWHWAPSGRDYGPVSHRDYLVVTILGTIRTNSPQPQELDYLGGVQTQKSVPGMLLSPKKWLSGGLRSRRSPPHRINPQGPTTDFVGSGRRGQWGW